MGERDSSWVLWCMVLGPTAPPKALLSVDGCQIVVVDGGDTTRDVLFSHVADVTCPGTVLSSGNKGVSQGTLILPSWNL